MGHFAQAEDMVEEANHPGGQSVQSVAMEGEYVPLAQISHSERPGEGPYFPGSQFMQSYCEKEPGVGRYLPSEQSVQVTVEVDSA